MKLHTLFLIARGYKEYSEFKSAILKHLLKIPETVDVSNLDIKIKFEIEDNTE